MLDYDMITAGGQSILWYLVILSMSSAMIWLPQAVSILYNS